MRGAALLQSRDVHVNSRCVHDRLLVMVVILNRVFNRDNVRLVTLILMNQSWRPMWWIYPKPVGLSPKPTLWACRAIHALRPANDLLHRRSCWNLASTIAKVTAFLEIAHSETGISRCKTKSETACSRTDCIMIFRVNAPGYSSFLLELTGDLQPMQRP
jgi:hypothetical protein